MLCGETVAVCCENRTERTDTVRTSQETHHLSATEPNRLILCGETVAVCCENRTEHTDTVRTSQETHRCTVLPECRVCVYTYSCSVNRQEYIYNIYMPLAR
jgi:hypothetical protein